MNTMNAYYTSSFTLCYWNVTAPNVVSLNSHQTIINIYISITAHMHAHKHTNIYKDERER